jgi:hypothetical protein
MQRYGLSVGALSKMVNFHPCRSVSGSHAGGYGYAGVMRRLIAYSRSSALVLTFKVSIIRYL